MASCAFYFLSTARTVWRVAIHGNCEFPAPQLLPYHKVPVLPAGKSFPGTCIWKKRRKSSSTATFSRLGTRMSRLMASLNSASRLTSSSCADRIARSSASCNGSDCPNAQQFKLLSGGRKESGPPPRAKEILRRHSDPRRKTSPQVAAAKAPPGPTRSRRRFSPASPGKASVLNSSSLCTALQAHRPEGPGGGGNPQRPKNGSESCMRARTHPPPHLPTGPFWGSQEGQFTEALERVCTAQGILQSSRRRPGRARGTKAADCSQPRLTSVPPGHFLFPWARLQAPAVNALWPRLACSGPPPAAARAALGRRR